jgi:hypothetical protein
MSKMYTACKVNSPARLTAGCCWVEQLWLEVNWVDIRLNEGLSPWRGVKDGSFLQEKGTRPGTLVLRLHQFGLVDDVAILP